MEDPILTEIENIIKEEIKTNIESCKKIVNIPEFREINLYNTSFEPKENVYWVKIIINDIETFGGKPEDIWEKLENKYTDTSYYMGKCYYVVYKKHYNQPLKWYPDMEFIDKNYLKKLRHVKETISYENDKLNKLIEKYEEEERFEQNKIAFKKSLKTCDVGVRTLI